MGSVRTLTEATGIVTDRYFYDAFGNLLGQFGTTKNSYLFAGERFDADLSLYYLRTRYYNPTAGRFVSRDPVEGNEIFPLSLNKYAYAENNPTNRVDPTGLSSFSPAGLGTALGVAAIISSVTMAVNLTIGGVVSGALISEDAFDGPWDAEGLGFQFGINLGKALRRTPIMATPAGVAVALSLSLVDAVGGFEILEPRNRLDELWLYGYSGATFGWTGASIVSGGIYRAFVWNLEVDEQYAGVFFQHVISMYLGTGTGFSGTRGTAGPHGFSLGMSLGSSGISAFSTSSSATYYFLLPPRPARSSVGLMDQLLCAITSNPTATMQFCIPPP